MLYPRHVPVPVFHKGNPLDEGFPFATMSAARLEVIKDHGEKIHVSRSMPAALEGLVSSDDFGVFCDKLDSSLQLLKAEQTRIDGQCGWIMVASYISFFSFFGLFSLYNPFRSTRYEDNGAILGNLFLTIICTIIVVIVVGLATRRPKGGLPSQELMRILRADCEEMTLNTPHGSFHVVLAQIGSKIVDHIAVSLAMTASLGNASVGVASCVAIMSSETDTSEEVVYAEAVATKGYQKVSADEGDGIELV